MDSISTGSIPALEDGTNAFVARVYQILFAVLAGIVLSGVASYYWMPAKWVVPVGSADGVIWTLCGLFGWRRPVALVLPVFAAINGLSLGLLARSYTDVFVFASILTLTASASLAIYVHFTERDFSFLSGSIAAGSFILLIGCVLVPFSASRFDHVGFAAFGTLVFLCWILYDTSQIVDRAESELTPAIAAFELLVDIVALHSWLFDLLRQALGRSSED